MFTEFPQLETKNLVLRQIEKSDAIAVYKFFSDSAVVRYHDVETFKSLERAEKLIKRWQQRFEDQDGMRWGIAKKSDNIIIGTCGFSWNKSYFCAETGYELAKAHWRKGIMSEALTAIIKFGFEQGELNRIQATVMLENIPSMKLLEKLGFKEEGTLREYGYWKGLFHDLKMFSLLKKDWSETIR